MATDIRTVVTIDAPAAAIWAVLADVDGWSRWNPLYPAASGSLAKGAALQLTVILPGMKPQTVGATVEVVQPPRRLEYGGRSFGGLLLNMRYVEIEETTPGRRTLNNGERMSGVLAPLLGRLVGERIRKGLEGMNAALKAEVEGRQTR